MNGLVPLPGLGPYMNRRLTHTAPLLPVHASIPWEDPIDIKLAMTILMLALLPILCVIALVGLLLGLPTLHITVYLLALECSLSSI